MTRKVSIIDLCLLRDLWRFSYASQIKDRNLIVVLDPASLLNRIIIISLNVDLSDEGRGVLISKTFGLELRVISLAQSMVDGSLNWI